MKIAVASMNPVKLEAARTAFERVFPEADISIVSVNASSGVPDQPMSDDETRQGAVNRARGALSEMDDADYGVGMEGGIERSGNSYMAFAWMAVVRNGGRLGESRSITLPLPPAIGELIDAGLELGEANDRVFETHNSKQAGGAYGLLTNGLLTRASVYADTLTVALAAFSHPVYSQ